MNILIVGPLFPPDLGVSTLRMNFLYGALDKMNSVDILKLGGKSDLNGEIKLLDRNIFESFPRAILNRRIIYNLLCKILKGYDLIIISAPPFGLYEVANVARKLNIPYILDLRDLPDLTSSEQKGHKSNTWLHLKEWIIDRYIRWNAKEAVALFCVGTISTALMQLKLRNGSCAVLNVHNGFEKDDLEIIRNKINIPTGIDRSEIIIGCVGNIHRFRDTPTLRNALFHLNKKRERITLKHWGKISPNLQVIIDKLDNINYIQYKPVSRENLLRELDAVDYFLLPCSDDLIWEPTTSVFDYILFNKPVIFTGLNNNEAYIILQNTNSEIITTEQISSYQFGINNNRGAKSEDVLMVYSREYYLDRIMKVINSVAETKI